MEEIDQVKLREDVVLHEHTLYALLEQVQEQIASPQVEQVVGAPAGPRPRRVTRTRQFTGAIRAQTPEEIERALAKSSLPGLEGDAGSKDEAS